jgi:hypothetical protein
MDMLRWRYASKSGIVQDYQFVRLPPSIYLSLKPYMSLARKNVTDNFIVSIKRKHTESV